MSSDGPKMATVMCMWWLFKNYKGKSSMCKHNEDFPMLCDDFLLLTYLLHFKYKLLINDVNENII